jgi:hypothetical protein
MTHQHAVETLAAERYLLDEMAELERFAFEEHYFSCAACAEDLRLSALMRDGAKAGLVEAPAARTSAPSRSVASHAGWRAILPWAAAASVAIAAGYQSLVTLPALRRQQSEPQVLAPITLRPASRGNEPTVALGLGGIATFAIDLNRPESVTSLTYELNSADGKTIASGRAPAPAIGAPLLLMIPASTLGAGGQYTLAVRNAENGAALGEYRFVVTER